MLLRYSIIITFVFLQVLPVAGQVSRKIKLTPVSLAVCTGWYIAGSCGG